MRHRIILHLHAGPHVCTTRAGVAVSHAVSFTSTSATPLISPRLHAQLAHVQMHRPQIGAMPLHVSSFLQPTCAWRSASHAASFLPHVRGSRAPSDGTSLIIPRLGAHLALRPTSSSTLNICIQPLLMTTVDPSVLGRAEGGVSGRSITIHVADTTKTRPGVGP